MSKPAVQICSFASGRDAATASGGAFVVGGDGAEDFVAIVPLTEVESAGEPPVEPSAVTSLTPMWAIRRVAGGSGLPVTSSLATRGRAKYPVGWTAITQDEWDLLVAWLLTEVVIGGEGGSLRSMAIRIDGPDGDPVELRITTAAGDVAQLLEKVRDGQGLYSVGPFECEEVK